LGFDYFVVGKAKLFHNLRLRSKGSKAFGALWICPKIQIPNGYIQDRGFPFVDFQPSFLELIGAIENGIGFNRF